jgi:hypothetical protein
MRAAAHAASTPAWPAPITMIYAIREGLRNTLEKFSPTYRRAVRKLLL